MSTSVPAAVWCGAGSPVIQGFLTGLGVLTAGTALFPFGFVVGRRAGDRFTEYAQSLAAAKWARWVAPVAILLSTATLLGYVILFVNAKGKFCDAHLTPKVQPLVVVWASVALAAIAVLVVAATLRGRARRSG